MKADRRYFCDLDKTFVCVNHEILSDKMFYYDTRGVIVQWLESYLIIIIIFIFHLSSLDT
jgi:hypothetical protein